MRTTVSTRDANGQTPSDQRHALVKSTLLAAGGFASAIATILIVAGQWNISDGTVRYAITVAGIVAAMAQLSALLLFRVRS